jgi:hypothetical protein
MILLLSLSQPVGTACRRHIGMASADYQEVILIHSEDEDFYFSDVFKEHMEISGMDKETELAVSLSRT